MVSSLSLLRQRLMARFRDGEGSGASTAGDIEWSNGMYIGGGLVGLVVLVVIVVLVMRVL